MKKFLKWFGVAVGSVVIFFLGKHAIENNSATPVNLPILYGLNCNIAHTTHSYDYIPFVDSMKTLGADVFRIPSGIMNGFNWRTDTPTIRDIDTLYSHTGIDIIIGLNMLSDSIQGQLQFLDSLKVPKKFIELGNEFNNLSSEGRLKYPNGIVYGAECNTWIDSVKKHYPDCMIGIIGENKSYSDNRNWNNDVMSICHTFNAFTYHCYIEPDSFIVSGVLDTIKLKQQIHLDWDNSGLEDTHKPIWITECNYKYSDKTGTSNLSEVNKELSTYYILKYLSELPLVRIICVNGLVSSKQGAFNVTKSSITLQPTGKAFKAWIQR